MGEKFPPAFTICEMIKTFSFLISSLITTFGVHVHDCTKSAPHLPRSVSFSVIYRSYTWQLLSSPNAWYLFATLCLTVYCSNLPIFLWHLACRNLNQVGYLLALSQPIASAAKDSCTHLSSSFYEFPAVELQVAVNPADSCFSLAAGDANICIPAYTGQVRARICKRLWSPESIPRNRLRHPM